MNCPHCGIAFHDHWSNEHIRSFKARTGGATRWYARTTLCPDCNDITIELEKYQNDTAERTLRVYPTNTFRKPTPAEVPIEIKEDYEEACKVLPISHKASAALSRRCLQAVLRDKGYLQRDLAQQIEMLLND